MAQKPGINSAMLLATNALPDGIPRLRCKAVTAAQPAIIMGLITEIAVELIRPQ